MSVSKNSAPAPAIASEVVDLVRGSLAPNSVGRDSVEFYGAVLAIAGIDPEALSFAEIVEVTRRLYGPSADFRRNGRAARAEARAEAEAIAKRERDAKAKAALLAKREALAAELAKLEASE